MNKWQPIETAPTDGTRVLLCSLKPRTRLRLKRDFPIIEVDFYHSIENGNAFNGWGKFNDVYWPPTHWMPLPPPPEGENE